MLRYSKFIDMKERISIQSEHLNSQNMYEPRLWHDAGDDGGDQIGELSGGSERADRAPVLNDGVRDASCVPLFPVDLENMRQFRGPEAVQHLRRSRNIWSNKSAKLLLGLDCDIMCYACIFMHKGFKAGFGSLCRFAKRLQCCRSVIER